MLDVYITDKITKPLHVQEWKEAASKAFPDLVLDSLSGEEQFPVDLLIGMDSLPDIRQNIIKTVGSLEARMSILGPYVEGYVKKGHNEGTPNMTMTNMNSSTSTLTTKYDCAKEVEKVVKEFDFENAERNHFGLPRMV